MNDLESKLRALTFREPPPGWRGSMVSVVTTESGWRKWFAPHPAAWAALAAIWLVLGIVSQTFESSSPQSSSRIAVVRDTDQLEQPTLFAFQFRAARGLEPPL